MVPQETGKPYMNWTQDPRNPRALVQPAQAAPPGPPAALAEGAEREVPA